MKWLNPVPFLFIMILKINHTESELTSQRVVSHLSDNGNCTYENYCLGTIKVSEKLIDKDRKYSSWSRWSGCGSGRKSRRKHCLRRRECGELVLVQVARCHNKKRKNMRKEVKLEEYTMKRNTTFYTQKAQKRQLKADEMHKRIRGFSSWSEWTLCSRKCTTVRRRYCMVPVICGRKILRQSAYCYLDGSYCQQWIKDRLQARKDPGIRLRDRTQLLPISMNRPIHNQMALSEPECGHLGHYIGPPADRIRARMQDMVRIIGGRPAPPGKWPWQVALLNRYKYFAHGLVLKQAKPVCTTNIVTRGHPGMLIKDMIGQEAFCGGTLISLRWVVTAAHCVRRRMYVRLGEHDLFIRSPTEVEMRVLKVVVHPKYDPDLVINDVAMLRLPWPARPDLGHGVACLPKPDQRLLPRTTCVILGWGKKRPSDTHGTRLLHEAQVSVIEQEVCRHSYWQYMITSNMVCAGRGRRDSCAGDSGGPLLCRDRDMRYYLQGITSFGDGCGKRDKFGIYTRTVGYVDWIKTVMQA